MESSQESKVCQGAHLGVHVRGGYDRTVIHLAWESRKLRMLKRQLDEHETAMSIAKGKGVRQPVERDQADRLSDLPKPANAPGHAPN